MVLPPSRSRESMTRVLVFSQGGHFIGGSGSYTSGGTAPNHTTRCALCEDPQLTAFFTSSPIFFSSAAVSFVSAHEVGHMLPSSRFASSLKPNVAYRALNLSAGWKKQTTLPSLAYAGIP